MRRKSTRNAQKATPDKSVKEPEIAPKPRRGRRRKRTRSKSTDSDDEPLVPAKVQAVVEAAPDTTTKSHSPSDDDASQEAVWKVTSSDDASKGEIQKLKICLTRPASESPEKSKPRRSKSNSYNTDDDAVVAAVAAASAGEDKIIRRSSRSRGSSGVRNECGLSSQDQEQDDDDDQEENKGKGKSKGKLKSKIEKSPTISESEKQTNNEISENVQVTPQSPSLDKPVDNENDSSKVVADDVKQIINENEKKEEESSTKPDDETITDDKIQNIETNSAIIDQQDETVKNSEDIVSKSPSPPPQKQIEEPPEQINELESVDIGRQESCTPPPLPHKIIEANPVQETTKIDTTEKTDDNKSEENDEPTKEISQFEERSRTPEGLPKEEEKTQEKESKFQLFIIVLGA